MKRCGLALLALFATGAEAQPVSEVVLGVGKDECVSVIKNAENELYEVAAISWFGGYLSSSNISLMAVRKRRYEIKSLNSRLAVWGPLISHCKTNPGERLIDGADALIRSLPTSPYAP